MKIDVQYYNHLNRLNYGYSTPCFEAKHNLISSNIEKTERVLSKAFAAMGAAFLAISSKDKKGPENNEVKLENKGFLKCEDSFKIFFAENPRINKNKFYSYINKLDLDKIKQIAPLLEQYTEINLTRFVIYHYLLGTEEFTEESLKLPQDLTNVISEYPFRSELYDLLMIYPNTDRNVGKLPEEWTKGLGEKSNNVEVRAREAIEKFIYTPRESFRMVDMLEAQFQKDLSEILQKKVEVGYLGRGQHAAGYKISVDGATPKVLKMFPSRSQRDDTTGEWAVIPIAFFLNRYEDKFVQAYTGKISHPLKYADGGGYLLSEYVNHNNKINVESRILDKKYKIFCQDVVGGHNTGDGKIYDYDFIKIERCGLFKKKDTPTDFVNYELVDFIKGLQVKEG